uniref:protein MRVI1 isoform X1 n=2 Tax=Podarcis muralis TaxID=64176 RepID=UPI0010A01424|nr:protein MRVI1 isoform X1 [Podarcis muralis]XP_028587142.1 protein MRVI1 isoform X1 [Podarcis muralis]
MNYTSSISSQGMLLSGNASSLVDEFVANNMPLSANCLEDDLINIAFEVCNTKETEGVPAYAFIKYLEDMTGHSLENGKLLTLYNMLDPKRQNVLVDRETFHETMKEWIAICCQDCISETEVSTITNRNLHCNDMMSFLSDEDADIYEGRPGDSEMDISKAFDLNSSVEDLKYMNQKMTAQLLGMQKVMELSEESYLQLTDDIVELRDRLASMQKPLENYKYIWRELEDTKNKMASLHEENGVIRKCVASLKENVKSLGIKLVSLEENAKAHEERNTSVFEALLFLRSREHFKNFLQEIVSQKDSMFQALIEEIELKQKMDHSLVTVLQTLANLCPFIETWNKVLKRLETFLEGPQLWMKSPCLNVELHEEEELGETNEQLEQSTLEAEFQASTNYMMNCDSCCIERANTRTSKEYHGANLSKKALQNVNAITFSSQTLTQTPEKDQILVQCQTWKKLLGGKKWWNPEGRLEAILEISKILANDKNTVLDEKKESCKEEHKIQPEQKKGNLAAAIKLKELVLRIPKDLCEGVSESNVTILYAQQMIKALQLWISEGEGNFLFQENSKETKENFQMDERMPNFTQFAEPTNCEDFNHSSDSITFFGMKNELPHCFSMAQQCSAHQENNNKMSDEKYSEMEKPALVMKNRKPSKEAAACCKSTLVLPIYFPFLSLKATYLLENDDSRLPTSLIDALNLEHFSARKRCCRTLPNLFFLSQRRGSKENLLDKERHAYKTEHGQDNKRAVEVNSQASTEDGVKHLQSQSLPRYSAVTQRPWDHKAPQCLSSEVNSKQTFPSVHSLFSQHCNPACLSPLIMPTLPEEEGQPTETQNPILPSPIKESPVEAATCNTPSIVLPENIVTPDTEREKNLAFRPVSPHLRHSHRNARTSASSLTSVDNRGNVIDLVNDQLPDVKISDEDKKKNLELLEEAKRVSERFLTRRGRKSRSSLSESPTAISPALSPNVSPAASRSNSFTLPSPTGSDICASALGSVPLLQNATKGLTDRNENDQRKLSQEKPVTHTTALENPKKLMEQKENFDPHKPMDNLPRSCTSGYDTGRVSLNTSPSTCENKLQKLIPKKPKENDSPFQGHLQGPGIFTMDPKLKGSVAPLPKDSKVSCKTELNTPGSRPPLLRAVSWDHAEPGNIEKVPFKCPSEDDRHFAINNKPNNISTKQSAFKDLQIQVQPVRMQKLTKLREEHILMRNQNLIGLKLPDLSEAAEQERVLNSSSGSSPVPFSSEEEEAKSRCEVMPNIPDTLLRKLRVHTSLPGSSPPLTEREVENVFVQLSLAFRNDSYTLESRINQAERERNLAEENTEKELDHFKVAITSSASLWHHSEHRDMYQRLLEDMAVLHRLASRLSSRAEMVGAVRQEKRMSKATEVMMQYVENLKRTYEKDHAELMEYKKLANQNSSRSYGSPEDGVPRTSRSMSLSVGKMPRRRVSVAVVSKFELPGQSPTASPIPLMPSLSESSNGRSNLTSTPVLSALIENSGKSNGDPESEPPPSAPVQSALEEISPEIKAKIEEEAYNKGYQEGLKKTKELEELKEDDEEKIDESPKECVAGESDDEISKQHSKLEVIIHYVQILYPKLHKHWNVLWIVAAVIIIFAVVLGISSLYNYFSSCTELSTGPRVKATCSAVQQYFWWNSGLQHDQRTE